ncbi:type IV secretory pathway TrbL component [Bradyrhizobium sp. USDA 4524]|uniref:Uncharacterized protein n=2 Tax=Bradyrhizobium TaxID=374 RepID=A0A1G6SGZ9_9BRAD|nr:MULTISPECIES: hypothetical protein [Bradyrhizobium]MCC8976878.1 hypothetical protein [Bradyrhizobium brasilense]MCP1843594.1 type IV secretory pathway TrbL component [Bradyrhizobium sp. USDA 4538]MCP1904160.1 type IV secretory pathway TrbL component [Bradyrhizobium sp. USDA 4537]MCP1990184.1 type IV secretory pathway TrbL component [Bradyrhizobium sp. USDA 4539]MCP3416763.1 hypothetical protein [Bradyrhizobium brasilense]
MTINAAILMAALVLSGTVLAQSSGPSAGSAGAGQAANVTTTGEALNSAKKTGDSGPPVEKAARPAKPDAGAAGNTVGASRPQKPDRRLEHYP